jgi:hypothetical protein
MTCDAPVRGGGTCRLDPGHRGYHSTVTFGCDGCGRTLRGQPHRTAPDGEYPSGLHFCFLCSDERVLERELREAEQARIEEGWQEPLTEGPIGVAGFLGERYS